MLVDVVVDRVFEDAVDGCARPNVVTRVLWAVELKLMVNQPLGQIATLAEDGAEFSVGITVPVSGTSDLTGILTCKVDPEYFVINIKFERP